MTIETVRVGLAQRVVPLSRVRRAGRPTQTLNVSYYPSATLLTSDL